jgi:hypothetical protein
MLFANPGEATIAREIKGVVYSCAPGELVEIPDELAYAIKAEGVALVPADSVPAKPEQKPENDAPAKPEQKRK